MLTHLPDCFWQWQQEYQPQHYLIACSGGVDSMVLLNLCIHEYERLQAPISVIYINHGWHENAPQWGLLVKSYCEKYDLDFVNVDLNLGSIIANKEAVARQARYEAFANHMNNTSVLLTAHHKNDQAETFLINLLRGSGLKGLSSMPYRKRFAQGEHWRPLLDVDRKAIEQYADRQQLKFVDDPSNQDTDLMRNWLRYEIIPLLEEKVPTAISQIAKSAKLLSSSLRWEQMQVRQQLVIEDNVLLLASIQPYDIAIQMLLIRGWLNDLGFRSPPQRQLQEWLRQVNSGALHAQLDYDDVVLIRHEEKLYVCIDEPISDAPQNLTSCVDWSGIGRLEICSGMHLIPENTYWGLYPPGGRFCPLNAKHHKSLKEWFRKDKIPPFLRARTPILRTDDEIIWVGGFGADRKYEEVDILWQK